MVHAVVAVELLSSHRQLTAESKEQQERPQLTAQHSTAGEGYADSSAEQGSLSCQHSRADEASADSSAKQGRDGSAVSTAVLIGLRGALRASTASSYSFSFFILHCTALHCTALHCTILSPPFRSQLTVQQ